MQTFDFLYLCNVYYNRVQANPQWEKWLWTNKDFGEKYAGLCLDENVGFFAIIVSAQSSIKISRIDDCVGQQFSWYVNGGQFYIPKYHPGDWKNYE